MLLVAEEEARDTKRPFHGRDRAPQGLAVDGQHLVDAEQKAAELVVHIEAQ